VAVDRPGTEQEGNGNARADRVHRAAARENRLIAVREVGRGKKQRRRHRFDARVAEGRVQPLHHEPVVAQTEAGVETEQPRKRGLQPGATVMLVRDGAGPQLLRHLRGFRGAATRSEHGGVKAARAASDEHVDRDAGAVQDIDEPQRSGTLDAARADDDGDTALVPM
jgi:hypothetical protein